MYIQYIIFPPIRAYMDDMTTLTSPLHVPNSTGKSSCQHNMGAYEVKTQ